jgi:hypothetical protein
MKNGAPKTEKHECKLISLKSLSLRWDCARSSAKRTVDRERMRITYFSKKGKQNEMIRVFIEDVETYEKNNTIRGSL